MDTIFTPYNGMFAFVSNNHYTTSTIALKLDHVIVPYTNRLWWKKDFFENSISLYSRYILNRNKVSLTDYIQLKPISKVQKSFLIQRLTPDSFKVQTFPRWFVNYADKSASDTSILEFVKYDFSFSGNKLLLSDSSSLFKVKVFNGAFIY